ncbi:hypothetical protein FRB94_014715 [Tulasnella sp. JGI-2019a]|nr:hypothetical protein FRB94_014715 [Tulasnella sp. JGI-2019a]
MAARRNQTRQQVKEITYCDSVHTLAMSPRSSAHNPNEVGSLIVPGTSYRVIRQEERAFKGPLGFVRRAIAACSRKPLQSSQSSRPSKRPSTQRKLSDSETAAVRQLLSPPPHHRVFIPPTSSSASSLASSSASLVISSPTSLSPSSSFTASSMRSRGSDPLYQPTLSPMRRANSAAVYGRVRA